MKFSLTSLHEKELKIVEKKKFFFLIPIIIIIIAIIMGVIFGVTKKTPFNLSMDFTGGYSITVRAGALISDNNYEEYSGKVQTAVEDFRFEYDNKEYGVEFDNIQRLGSRSDTSLRIEYRADKSLPSSVLDSVMEDLNEELLSTLNDIVGYMTPVSVDFTTDSGVKYATVVYDGPIKAYGDFGQSGGFKSMLASANIAANNIEILKNDSGVYNTVKFAISGDHTEEEVKAAMAIDKYFSARAISGSMISGTVSGELIYSAITAILFALLLMLAYIFFRFEFASGVAAIIALFHDVIMMLAFMVIFHIEINATFIAALITILGYSINNAINIFDRVREMRKSSLISTKTETASSVCNRALRDVLPRCIITSLTTLIMMVMVVVVCAIGGVFDMVNFSLPIIFGLIAGAFSSICIAPSMWVLFKRNRLGAIKQPRSEKKENKEPAKQTTAEVN